MKEIHRRGFTLVEVIVVLVLLAVLAAIMIPALTGFIDRANEKAAIAECRQVVLAGQGVASELYADTVLTANILYSSHLAQIQGLSEVTGTIESILIDPDTALVTFVSYLSAAGVRVEYRAGVYSVDKIGVSAPGVSGSVSTSGLSGTALSINRALIAQFAAANGGALPSLSSYELNLLQSLQKDLRPSSTATFNGLYWRPVVYDDAGNFYLVASSNQSTSATNVQGTMVYYNGSYYYHTNGYGTIDNATVGDGGSVAALSPAVLDNAGTTPVDKTPGWVKAS